MESRQRSRDTPRAVGLRETRSARVQARVREAAGFDVKRRAEKGMWPSEKIDAPPTAYGVLLCLSFNNDHCFDPQMFPRIPKDRKINRLFNLRDILWSKHKFCGTVGSALKGLPDKFHSFTFPCWVMPGKYTDLVSYAEKKQRDGGGDDSAMPSFIVKPRSLAPAWYIRRR